MISAGLLVRKARNELSRIGAEVKLWRAGRSAPRAHPRVLFFPSGQREGASLLRAYNVAEALCARGWLAGTVPGTVNLSGRARIIRRFKPDLLVFQQCRHPLNDGEFAFGVPYVVDTDDADFHLEIPGLAERLERTVRGARGVIAGSRYIADHLKRLNQNVAVIWTGTPISHESWPCHTERQTRRLIVAWAQAQPLDYRLELEFVADLDRRLRKAGAQHTLRLYGVNSEAERAELAGRFGGESVLELLPTLAYEEFIASLADVSIGLCPLISEAPFSRGKSFGKILAYLNRGVPVVASDAADHALLFDEESGVISNDVDTWEQAILALLANPSKRDEIGERASVLLRERLSLDAVAVLTDRFLRAIVDIPSAGLED